MAVDRVLMQFLAVAEEGSITRAAETLHISQPALTTNLKRLEHDLKVQLFTRTSRGVKLTRYGETLYENVAIMHRLYDNALDTIERQRLHFEEGVSIGSGYTWWTLFLRDLMVEYNRKHSDAPLNVILGNTLRCMDQLVAGDISLFIGHRIEDLFGGVHADFLEIGPTRDGFFVREGHPLVGRRCTQVDLNGYQATLAFPPEARQQRLLLENGKSRAQERQPDYMGRAFTSNSLEACIDYALVTNAVLRHTDLMESEFKQKGLVMLELEKGERALSQPVGIYVLSERRTDRRISELIDIIQMKTSALIKASTTPG